MFQQSNNLKKEVRFFLFKNDYHSGPFEIERIREMMIEGIVNENDIICAEGDKEWFPISQLFKTSAKNDYIPATEQSSLVLEDTLYLLIENETKGPFTLNQIKMMWNSGNITVQTMFLSNNNTEWMPLRKILHKLEPPQQISTISDNIPPILKTTTKKVQTIEATSKTWKGLLVFAVFLMIAGIITLFSSFASGCGILFAGFLMFLFARAGSWWSHG